MVVLRRKVGAAKEHFPFGCQKRGERPAALSGERLHGTLVAGVHVGPLVAIDLDAHEIAVQERGHLWILVRLAVHHMAPVAPHGADVQQDRLVLAARPRQRRLAPRGPMHRLGGGGLPVPRGLGGGGGGPCRESSPAGYGATRSPRTASTSSA